jgi:hypothetical protein
MTPVEAFNNVMKALSELNRVALEAARKPPVEFPQCEICGGLRNALGEDKCVCAELAEEAERLKPVWIVNSLGELGVKVGDKFYFMYKGESLVYTELSKEDGIHMMWRPIGKREFGETQHPQVWVAANRSGSRYSEGSGWQDLPLVALK